MTNKSAFSDVQAIIFDAEGVVIDTEPLWDEVQLRLLKRRGLDYDRSVIKHLLAGKTALESTATLKEAYSLSDPVEQLLEERNSLFRELLESDCRFIVGFTRFHDLVSRSCKTALATSLSRSLLSVVARQLSLSERFGQHIVSPEDVDDMGKPDPAIYLRAAESTGVLPRCCLAIEDSPIGIESARRAGTIVVGLVGTFKADELRQADLVADSFFALERSWDG